jgi:phosphate transport system protein
MTAFEFSDADDRAKRERTLVQIIEAIDEHAPETKSELGEAVGLSDNYLSELLRDLKSHDLITKAYVVNQDAVFDAAQSLSVVPTDGSEDEQPGRQETSIHRLFDRLDDLDAVTASQYEAARARFDGETPPESAADLEPLANERSRVVFEELKSMTLSTSWPGNRVAADLSTVAMNLEIVGDRACFLSDGAQKHGISESSAVHERLATIFEHGSEIHRLLRRILFDLELDRLDTLYGVEDDVHRQLNELFELVTTYDPEQYGRLASLTRTLEQTIYYWVHTAELAVRLHSGITPDHISEL